MILLTDNKFNQLIPLVLFSIVVVILCIDSIRSGNKETDISINGSVYVNILYLSTGILIPFVFDNVQSLDYVWNWELYREHLEILLLPSIMTVMFAFNIYFLAVGEALLSSSHIWNYYTGTYIQLIFLYNFMMSMQMQYAQKAWDLRLSILCSSVLTTTAFLVKYFAAIYGHYRSWKPSWFIFFGLSLLCNLYIAGNWWDKYWIAYKTGQARQSTATALLLIMSMVVFVFVYLVLDMCIPCGDEAANISASYVSATHALLTLIFFVAYQILSQGTKSINKLSEQALETKRAFVRYVSHEIRTPMNTTLIGLELLKKEVKLFCRASEARKCEHLEGVSNEAEESLLELIHDTSQSCDIAIEILNDLLLYEKIDGGLLVLEEKEILLWPFILDVLKLFDVQAKAMNLELIAQCNLSSDVYVTIDTYKMSQVIRNLVSNALKFSTTGGKVYIVVEGADTSLRNTFFDRQSLNLQKSSFAEFLGSPFKKKSTEKISDLEAGQELENSRVNTSDVHMLSPVNHSRASIYSPDSDLIRISVTDFGAGLSKENQQRLFKEIVQFDAAKLQQGKGSGIGLWISNRIMKLHGGNIGVESAGEGCGSTFYIDIPITRAHYVSDSSHSDLPNNVGNHLENVVQEISSRRHHHTIRRNSYMQTRAETENIAEHPKNHQPFSVSISKIDEETEEMAAHSTMVSLERNSSILSYEHKRTEINEIPGTLVVHQPPPQTNEIGSSVLITPQSPQCNTRKSRLLITDDSVMNRKLLKRALTDLFDQCDEATHGGEAIEKTIAMMKQTSTNTGYDIIITDYSMPVMGGLEAVRKLRQLGYHGKIIGLTGNTETSLLEEFEAAGVDMVLIKPFQTDDLRKILQAWLAELEYFA